MFTFIGFVDIVCLLLLKLFVFFYRHSHDAYAHAYHPASYTMAVKGVQKFNITENLFGNSGMDYELLAGINTARVSNYLNAELNYWGSADLNVIREKLFDFDDWNSYAITHFLPYYLTSSFESSLSNVVERKPEIDLDNLGIEFFFHLVNKNC